MANRAPAPDTPELRKRWGAFAWTAESAAKAKNIVKRYPEGRQLDAVMPFRSFYANRVDLAGAAE
jgi:NADH-quinone oxidoreductase subunit E